MGGKARSSGARHVQRDCRGGQGTVRGKALSSGARHAGWQGTVARVKAQSRRMAMTTTTTTDGRAETMTDGRTTTGGQVDTVRQKDERADGRKLRAEGQTDDDDKT